MDYFLKSLKEAFTNSYYNSNNNYKFNAILLATSLDKDFVLDYLTYFKEMQFMTGKEVLIIGPQLVDPDNYKNRSADNFGAILCNTLAIKP